MKRKCETGMKRNSLKAWVLAARPKTLTGAAVPVMIGLSMAWADGGRQLSWVPAMLCLLFAFVMQIDANLVNDYFDFVRGTDDKETRLGPERACTQGWVSIAAMKRAIVLTTCVACLIGLPLVLYGGWKLLLVGVACVVFCFLYTTCFSYIGLGDVRVLVFFGLVPVVCTYYIQMQTVGSRVLVASLACGLVIDALLLVNNFRDRDSDRLTGKHTLVVRMGAKAGLYTYLGTGITACLLGTVFIPDGHWPAFVLPLLYLLLHFKSFCRMKQIWEGRALNSVLGQTARNIFVYGLLVSIGFLL